MPDVTISGAAHVERWAAVVSSELTAEPMGGLTPMENAPGWNTPLLQNMISAVKGWRPGAGPVWKITSPQWELNLTPRDAASPAVPIEVFLAEYQAAVMDGGRWRRQAVYWLRHEANTDLNLTFPADAEVSSVAIDGAETAPLQAEPRRLWMPLTGRPAVMPGPRPVEIRRRRVGASQPRRPDHARSARGQSRLDRVRATGLGAGNPEPNERPTARPCPGRGPVVAAPEARFHMSAVLASRASDGADGAALAETQRQFYAECRRCKQALEIAPAEPTSGWPVGRGPLESLMDLLQRNKDLAEKRHFESVRATAERQAEEAEPERTNLWEAKGRPLYARQDGGEPAPVLTLRRTELDQRQKAWTFTWIGLGILLLVELFSLSRTATTLLRFTWPEQVALLGLVGWWAAGATWVVLGLLLLAIGARALVVLNGFTRLARRPPPDKSKSTANMPVVP